MSRRTLMIALLSAAVAFAGGYALLDTLQAAGDATSSYQPDPRKVVAVPGSALVPVGDGSTDWMLIGPDGTVLAGPDGLPPRAASDVGSAQVFLTSESPRQAIVGDYLVNFVPDSRTGKQKDEKHERDHQQDDDHDGRRDHDDHDDDYQGEGDVHQGRHDEDQRGRLERNATTMLTLDQTRQRSKK